MSADAGPQPQAPGEPAARYGGASGEDSGRRCQRCSGALVEHAHDIWDGQYIIEVVCRGCGHAGVLRDGGGFGAVFQPSVDTPTIDLQEGDHE